VIRVVPWKRCTSDRVVIADKSSRLLARTSALDAAGDHDNAARLLEQFLRREPWHAEATVRLATMEMARQDNQAATRRLERLLRVKPDLADAQATLATVYLAGHRVEDALACALRMVGSRPRDPWALVILARAHLERGGPGAAQAALEAADRLNPSVIEQAEIQFELGRVAESQGYFQECIAHFRRSTSLAPDLIHAHQSLGMALLRMGCFQEGWREHEWRRRSGRFKATMPPAPPEFYWNGKEDLVGQFIYITYEQGAGDAILFFRYVPLVKARGARVVYGATEALAPLFAGAVPGVQVVAKTTDALRINYLCSAMSLPAAFGTTLATIPATVPYLRADPERVARWAPRLAGQAGHRVGLAWSGSPANPDDSRRSIAAALFLEIATVPNIAFCSLQYEVRESDRPALEANSAVARVGEAVQDFADVAAIIDQLDLVIAVDTAIAHLAGALGKPVWILLPFVSDWRWFTGRDDSPWYPTARLFRQEAAGEWRPVIARVKAMLERSHSKSAEP